MLTQFRTPAMQADLLQYYAEGDEAGRLQRPESGLELIRTRDILTRYLPYPPAEVLDVGGGPAVHSYWLARLGYRVHLVDLVPRHIEQARQLTGQHPHGELASLQVGDARTLEFPDQTVDAVVLFGPLYHLLEKADRLRALKEAQRVLRPGGVLLAQGISRYIYAIKCLVKGTIVAPRVANMVSQNVRTGQHTPIEGYRDFTSAYFHRPHELAGEVGQAGFKLDRLLAVEGPARLLGKFGEHWQNPAIRHWLLELVQSVEEDESILGLSGHFIAVARKEAQP